MCVATEHLINVIIYQLSRYNIFQFINARGAEQMSRGGEEEVRPVQIRPMEAATGDRAKTRGAEQKSGGGGEGGEEEAQAAAQTMPGEEEQRAHDARK